MLKGLKGLGGLGDMGKMMQAARDMQGRMEEMQARLDTLTVTGESGAGLVRATATAKGELTALEIDPSIFVPSEKEVVEDLILAAIKDAQRRAGEAAQKEMARITGETHSRKVLDLDVPVVELPVAAGRNLAVLTEAAVRLHLLRSKGMDPAAAFLARHSAFLQQGEKE